MPQTISIAAPAYNEGEGIYSLVEGWLNFLQKRLQADEFEIVICDDGSTDDTWGKLSALSLLYPSVRPFRHVTNQGAGAALATAISQTANQWIFLLDSDGQYPIENLDNFRKEMSVKPASAYIGYRLKNVDSTFAKFGSWISGQCCNRFHGTHFKDFNCALKMVDGPLLRDLCLEAKGLNYSTEISSKLLERKIVMLEVQAEHCARAKGRSTRTLLRGSVHRFLFVLYIGVRQVLLKLEVLNHSRNLPI